MTIKEFIDTRVRPCIGDTLHQQDCNPQLTPPLTQMAKYDLEVLIDYLNEGVLDISRHSDMFIKTGYTLVRAQQTDLVVPTDYLGFYKSSSVSAGELGYNESATMPEIKVVPTRTSLKLATKITEGNISRYQNTLKGVDLPSDIIDYLIETRQIVEPPVGFLGRDLISDAILIAYEYKYLPVEFTKDDVIVGRELKYLLKWFTSSHALYGDMHNEAINLAQVYEMKYRQRLEEAGQSETNWNSVSLTPWGTEYSKYI